MPPLQGEVSLLTLFADVHYYYSPPTAKPPHHRFDKTSFVYLYHSPIQQRGRIEIANHAGTPDQDAFNGHLDNVRIEQSYKHPCLFTITVDGFRGQGGSSASSPQQDMSEWHLPAPDPRNDGKYMYRLHTVDIYFWTTDDATMFLDSLKRVTQPHQLQITTNPALASLEHKTDVMNPLVQKLERAAVSKQYHSSRSPSISTTQSFPGPPTVAPTAGSGDGSGDFAPLAYNPAAPAAPEPIAHREKTPPPPDAADGTGLSTAALHDERPPAPYGNPLQSAFAPQSTAAQPYMPGPPSRTNTQAYTGTSVPGIQRTNTGGTLPPPPPPQSSSTGPPSTSPYAQSFAPPPSAPPPGQYDPSSPPPPGIQRHATMPVQYANYPNSPGHPPVGSPGVPSPGYAPQYQPVHSPGHPPVGGYSQYSYGQAPGQTGAEMGGYGNMHQQLYRPTEQEASIRHNEPTPQPSQEKKGGKLEHRAEKIEKGVGRFLKKLDKKL